MSDAISAQMPAPGGLAVSAGPAAAAGDPAAITLEPSVRDYWALLKPRVMSLVVFTALVGMLVAPMAPHPVIGLAALLCIAVGAGAAGALNMWWDADIDKEMARTANRPIPAGRVAAEDALWLGAGLSVLSVALLTLFANALAGALLALTIAYYLFIYTMWLKRLTSQNIVIGGAAGAFPPMIGWVVATGQIGWEAVAMFLIIFLWTPPHSWALALFRNADYTAVSVPMLPAAAGERAARLQIWLYALALTPVSAAPLLLGFAGPVYALAAVYYGAGLLTGAWRLYRRSPADAATDGMLAEKRYFGFTIKYLFALFAALLADALIAGALAALGVSAAGLWGA